MSFFSKIVESKAALIGIGAAAIAVVGVAMYGFLYSDFTKITQAKIAKGVEEMEMGLIYRNNCKVLENK